MNLEPWDRNKQILKQEFKLKRIIDKKLRTMTINMQLLLKIIKYGVMDTLCNQKNQHLKVFYPLEIRFGKQPSMIWLLDALIRDQIN